MALGPFCGESKREQRGSGEDEGQQQRVVLFTVASMRRVKESMARGIHAATLLCARSATEAGLTTAIRHDDVN
jgi:hypothetical protein